jgi:hypothetical protein
VLCLQESKLMEDKLTQEAALVEGFESYWAFSTEKRGYSGVTSYISSCYAPVSCQMDGLSGSGGADVIDREGRHAPCLGRHRLLELGDLCRPLPGLEDWYYPRPPTTSLTESTPLPPPPGLWKPTSAALSS